MKKGQYKLDKYNSYIIDGYNSGKSINYLSNLYSSSYETISDLLHRNNVNVTSNKYSYKESYFENIDSQDKAYFLGFLYADGNRSKSQYKVSLKLQEKDKHILETFQRYLDTSCPLKRRKTTHQDQYSLEIYNKKISNDLYAKGLIPAKSLILDFPNFLNDDSLCHFVRGYFDGDGCFTYYLSKNHYKTMIHILGSGIFCDKLSKILKQKLNINSYIYHPDKNKIFDLTISGNVQVRKFMEWLYQNSSEDLRLKRKYIKYVNMKYILDHRRKEIL